MAEADMSARCQRSTLVWVIGSYGSLDESPVSRRYSEQLTRLLGRALAIAQFDVVCGQSDMLDDLCDAYRGAVQPGGGVRAIMFHGSMRSGDVFGRHLKQSPATALIIGGGVHSRSVGELRLAQGLGMAIGGFEKTGGVVGSSPSAFDAIWADEDPSDAAQGAVRWIRDTDGSTAPR